VSNAIPAPLRAVAGLAAATIDEAKRLPAWLVGFPVMAVSTALQTSLKVQQHYADLIVRGDELLAQLRPEPSEAPSWAQFDDDLPSDLSSDLPSDPPSDPADSKLADLLLDEAAPAPADEALPDDLGSTAAPVDGYDDLSVPQLRGRLRQFSEPELASLLDYESATLARAPYLTMLGNRLHTLRQG
jgi:hypothetical protein